MNCSVTGFNDGCSSEIIWVDSLPILGDIHKLYIVGNSAYRFINPSTPQLLFESGTFVLPISLNNTVWVNTDLTTSDSANRIFKTYAEAITWIHENGGTLSFTNMWQVICPAFMEAVTLYDYILVQCNTVATVINELTLSVYYVLANVNQISVIHTLDLNGKNLLLNDCLIDEITGIGYLRLEDCYVNGNDVISGLTIESKRTHLDVVVKEGGVLFTKSCTGSVEVENGGTWDNQGELFDNRGTSLTSTNMQDVIIELNNLINP